MKQSKLRLLLLSVGSLASQNVIDALGARRELCVLIGTNSIAEAAGNFRCDTVYLVPPAASGAAYIERVAELIREEHPDLVIPCRDDDVLALAMLGEQSPRSDAVLLTGTVAAARMMNDKVETARFAARHGLPFAPTATNAREALDLAKAHRLPLIGKPRSGYASHGVVLLRSTAEIERAFELSPDLIAQPFLDPPSNMDALIAPFEAGLPFFFSFPLPRDHTVQVIVGPDRTISNVFGCLNRATGGQTIQNGRFDDPELIEIGRSYALAAAAEGWKGPLNVQLRRTSEGRLIAFELNGRFGGGTAPRALMGFDEIGEVVRRFLAEAAFPSISMSESDLTQNYLCSYPFPREGVAALRTFGRWSRAGRE
jgi:carbamoylphosphate synthase large subunit